MADKLVPSRDDPTAIRRFTDMGDGTWAEKLATSASAPAAGAASYPTGATPVQASTGIIANSAASASLPAVVGKTNYVTSIQVMGAGATASTLIAATLAGLLGGSIIYPVGVSAVPANANAPIVLNFNPPLPASAANVAITLSTTAYGVGNIWAMVALQGFVV